MVALWTVIWTTLALLLYLLTRRHRLPLALARRVWAPGVLAVVGARLAVDDPDQLDFDTAHLFIANHASQLDIPVAFAALPVPLRFLAKKELRRLPLVGQYIAAMGMVFIDRHDSESARESIDHLSRVLGGGASVLAFPEGTRSRTGEVRPFKTGVFVAAIKSGVSIVPMSISGTAAILPAGGVRVRPGEVQVRIGRPLTTLGLDLSDRRALADAVRDRLIELAATASARGE
jgi:1-acyl-sn-glycerol-3-phosphate acyltransferase